MAREQTQETEILNILEKVETKELRKKEETKDPY